ncbi:hypothetical protein MRB53_042311 [Persea americana]|nr:hypothetical protein MRB53_042311 [Persea americana]
MRFEKRPLFTLADVLTFIMSKDLLRSVTAQYHLQSGFHLYSVYILSCFVLNLLSLRGASSIVTKTIFIDYRMRDCYRWSDSDGCCSGPMEDPDLHHFFTNLVLGQRYPPVESYDMKCSLEAVPVKDKRFHDTYWDSRVPGRKYMCVRGSVETYVPMFFYTTMLLQETMTPTEVERHVSTTALQGIPQRLTKQPRTLDITVRMYCEDDEVGVERPDVTGWQELIDKGQAARMRAVCVNVATGQPGYRDPNKWPRREPAKRSTRKRDGGPEFRAAQLERRKIEAARAKMAEERLSKKARKGEFVAMPQPRIHSNFLCALN